MKASFYVQFEATHNRHGDVIAVKASRITQGRPYDRLPGAVLARLTVDVPDHVFQPLEAEGALQAEHVEVIPLVHDEDQDGQAATA